MKSFGMPVKLLSPQAIEDRQAQLDFRAKLDKMYLDKHPQPDFILLTDDIMVKAAYQNLINPIK